MSTTRKPIRLETWIFAAVMVVLFALFAWRQFFGFNKNDEIFYISTVYRFFQGDAMLVDEWNNTAVCVVNLSVLQSDSVISSFQYGNDPHFSYWLSSGTWSSCSLLLYQAETVWLGPDFTSIVLFYVHTI